MIQIEELVPLLFLQMELDPNKHVVVTCGLGGQAALSGKTLKKMASMR